MSRFFRLPATVAAIDVFASLATLHTAGASPAVKAAAAPPAPWTKDDLQAAKMLRDRHEADLLEARLQGRREAAQVAAQNSSAN